MLFLWYCYVWEIFVEFCRIIFFHVANKCSYETRGGKYKKYIDKGFSGKNTNRPAFEEMLKDVEKGLIKKVIVYKLDRIIRSILDFYNMMEVFQKYHVEFV